MNTDIRISVSFRTHRKRKRLKMMLGLGSTDYLIDLWISTAMNRPSGVLTGLDETDIAIDAGWEGDPFVFVDALVKCGFVDFDGTTYSMHDWEDHQGYVVHADDRKDRAKKAAEKRWASKNNAGVVPEACGEHAGRMPEACGENAASMPEACGEHAECNAPSPAPSPSPAPLAKEKPPISPKGDGEGEDAPTAKTPKKRQAKTQLPLAYSQDFEAAWLAYPRRDRKGAAWAAWEKAIKRNMPVGRMVEIITARKSMRDWQKDGGQFAPHMATWLNQNGWEDEVTDQASTAKPTFDLAAIQAMVAIN